MKKNPTPRRARRLVLASLILPISLGILSLPWRGARPPRPPVVEAAQVGHGPLQAGAASRVVDLGAAPTIGGFPRFRWGAAGVKDPITARALVLSEPGCTVALASAELLVVPGALERAVSARLAGAGVDALVVAATHTHAGPGGYWDSLPGELGATGPYDAATFERVADAVAGAVRDALAARAPATLAVARGRFPELVRNRGGGSVDGRVLSVRVARPGGEPVAELVSFAAHPTMLGGRNRLVSGDWPARLLAGAKGGTRLFFQGAVGDQSTHLLPGDEEADPLDAYAGALDGYLARLEAGPADAAPRLGAATATVVLPRMSPGALPRWLRPAAATLLGGTFPAAARVTAVRAGDALLVFTPSEPVEAVGRSWREAAGPGAEVLSLASDYVGYVETAEKFREGSGEAKRSYYGPQLATRLEAAVVAAARAVDQGSR